MDNIFQKLNKDKITLDILFAIDEFFENNYLYVYPGVIDFIIEAGPHVMRHWVGIVYKTYSYPDKNFLETLQKFNIKYEIKNSKEKFYYQDPPVDPLNPTLTDRAYYSYYPMENLPKEKYVNFYRIFVLIPKKIIDFDWTLPHVEKIKIDSNLSQNNSLQEIGEKTKNRGR